MILLSKSTEAFLCVARLSTVGGAAEEMHLTQTAVTQRIKALEEELGVSLFVRSRRGMVLTSEGKTLLRYCTQAAEIEGQALSSIRESGSSLDITVTIGGPTSVVSSRIALQCKPLYERFPKLNLSFLIEDSENLIQLLKQGSVEMAIVRPDQVVDEIESKNLKPLEWVLVGHPDWKHRTVRQILETERIIDFHASDPTSLNYLKAFRLQNVVKRPRMYANENQTLISMFCAGIGFGTLVREIAEPYIAENRLVYLNDGKSAKEAISLVWYRRSEMPKYFKNLIDIIQ